MRFRQSLVVFFHERSIRDGPGHAFPARTLPDRLNDGLTCRRMPAGVPRHENRLPVVLVDVALAVDQHVVNKGQL